MSNKKANGFFEVTKKATKNVALSTIEIADLALLNMKLKARQTKLSQKYENLGRLYYEHAEGSAKNKSEISKAMREIEAAKTAIDNTIFEIQSKKEARGNRKY